jgi:M6 family metalloprotease-like protein
MRLLLAIAALAVTLSALAATAGSAALTPYSYARVHQRVPPVTPPVTPPMSSSRCRLPAAPIFQPNEGPTDTALHLPSRGQLSAVMVFVDFDDAPASEDTSDLYDQLAPRAIEWYAGVSKGRLALSVTPVHTWFRMPDPSSSYGWSDGLTFEEHRAYIADAIAVSNDAVDYSGYRIVYVVAANGSAITFSPAFHAYPGTGIPVDGIEIRHSATLGEDIRVPRPHYGAYVLVHETGHLLGLPDLYRYGLPLYDAVEDAGGWDPMSFLVPGASFNAWHRWKLGWIDDRQIVCAADRHRRIRGVVEATLEPLEAAAGLKAIVVPIGSHSVYVVEVRTSIGEDSRLCDQGVLVYTVDSSVANGSGPIQVKPANNGTDPSQIDACAPKYDAPYDLGPGEVALFADPANGVTVQLLGSSGGSYKVRVTKS